MASTRMRWTTNRGQSVQRQQPMRHLLSRQIQKPCNCMILKDRSDFVSSAGRVRWGTVLWYRATTALYTGTWIAYRLQWPVHLPVPTNGCVPTTLITSWYVATTAIKIIIHQYLWEIKNWQLLLYSYHVISPAGGKERMRRLSNWRTHGRRMTDWLKWYPNQSRVTCRYGTKIPARSSSESQSATSNIALSKSANGLSNFSGCLDVFLIFSFDRLC